jgi:predicted MPP superfamily phosphohydrolase
MPTTEAQMRASTQEDSSFSGGMARSTVRSLCAAFPIERSLAERLRPRIAVEQEFARRGGKIKTKSLFRQYEKRIVAPLIKAGFLAFGLYDRAARHALSPVVTELDLEFPNLPAAFDGFRLLHLSDLHIDGVVGLTERLVPILDGLEADLCVLAGDYRFDDEGSCEEVYRRVRKLLASIHSSCGVYGILGNHDEAAIAFELEEMGIRMLINEAVEIQRGRESVWLAGIDDPFDYKVDDIPGALAQVPDAGFKILLAHTPDLYEDAADRDVHLYLCGHTHGGQVRLPYIGAVRSNAKCARRYTYGYWNFAGMHGYTSGGVGCSSLPIRLNCPPEIVLLTLRRI